MANREPRGPAIRVLRNHGGTAEPQTIQPHTWEHERTPPLRDFEILGEHSEAVGIELRRTVQQAIRVLGKGSGTLVKGSFASGAKGQALDITGETAFVTGNIDVPPEA